MKIKINVTQRDIDWSKRQTNGGLWNTCPIFKSIQRVKSLRLRFSVGQHMLYGPRDIALPDDAAELSIASQRGIWRRVKPLKFTVDA